MVPGKQKMNKGDRRRVLKVLSNQKKKGRGRREKKRKEGRRADQKRRERDSDPDFASATLKGKHTRTTGMLPFITLRLVEQKIGESTASPVDRKEKRGKGREKGEKKPEKGKSEI